MKTSTKQVAAIGVCGWLLVSLGCSMPGTAQLEKCQADKKQLLARVVEEQKRSESLTADLRTANQKLADAEKQLARTIDGSRSRYATATPSLGPGDRSFVSGPQPITPIGSGTNGNSGPGMMASGNTANRLLSLGSPNAVRRDGGSSNDGYSNANSGSSSGGFTGAPASPNLDPSGFDQLAPRNGRSESGWMPKSTARP